MNGFSDAAATVAGTQCVHNNSQNRRDTLNIYVFATAFPVL